MYQRKVEFSRIDHLGKEWYFVHERVYVPGEGWTDWLLIGSFRNEDVLLLLSRSETVKF